MARATADADLEAARAWARDRFPVVERAPDAGRRAARPAHAPPAHRADRDHGADRGGPAGGQRAGGAPPRPAAHAAAVQPARRRRRAGRCRCGSPAATSACRPRPSGASGIHGSRSRTGSAPSAASSSAWRAARSGRCRRASARTCGRWGRGRPRPCWRSPARPRSARSATTAPAAYDRSGAPTPRVRLVLGQPPIRPSLDRLAAAYHGTAWTLGREAAAMLPIDALADNSLRAPWSWQAVAIGRSLAAVEPSMARDGRVVQLVDGGMEALAAVAIGGASAGYRVAVARLSDPDDAGAGVIELLPPGAAVPPGPRTRANVGLPARPGRVRRSGHRPRPWPVRAAGALRPAPVLGGRCRQGRDRVGGRDAARPRRARPDGAAVRRDPRRPRPVGPAPAAGHRRAPADGDGDAPRPRARRRSRRRRGPGTAPPSPGRPPSTRRSWRPPTRPAVGGSRRRRRPTPSIGSSP